MSETQPIHLPANAQNLPAKPGGWLARRALPSRPAVLPLTLMVWCLGVPSAVAKPPAPALLYCAAYSSDVKSVFLKGDGGGQQGISLSIANIIELPEAPVEGGRITLFGSPGENGERPVVAIAETGGFENPLIVLHPSGEGDETAYRAITVNADRKAFPPAGFHLLNLSPHPVRISHDEAELIEMESGGSHNFRPAAAVGTPLAIKVEYKADGNWSLVSSSSWVARNDRRTLVCILHDPRTGRMNIRSVPLRDIPER